MRWLESGFSEEVVISLLAFGGSFDIVLLYGNNYHIANGEKVRLGGD